MIQPVQGQLSTNETPAHASITKFEDFGFQTFGDPSFVDGGVAFVCDAAGNYYHATGAKIVKYDPDGLVLWSQSQESVVTVNNAGGQTQYRYYDRWTDASDGVEDFELGVYEGDQASFYAQKIVLDAAGDVYVSFLDLLHRDRSVLAKFDGATGIVQWAARVGIVPANDAPSTNYVSKVVGLDVLPDQSVAILETGIGTRVHAFTRLIIFASDSNDYAGGTRIRQDNYVYRNDGDSSYRISLGVGMAAAADGTLYYATYEGDDPGTYPGSDPYENFEPYLLVFRKISSPYTGAPVEHTVTTSGGILGWNDLEIGPGGNIYVLGSQRYSESNSRRTPVLGGFNSSDFSTLFPLSGYTSPDLFPDRFDLPGMRLFSTGIGVNDSLYLTTGPVDQLRENTKLGGGFSWSNANSNPAGLFVVKVDGSGTEIWKKHEPANSVYASFIDDGNNVYFLGSDPGTRNTVDIYKYSPFGALQFAKDFATSGNNRTEGRFVGLIDSFGDLVVAFPQLVAPDLNYFESRLAPFDNPANIDGPGSVTIDFPEFTSSALPGQVLTLSATASNNQPVFFHIPVGSDNGNTAYVAGDGTSLVLLKSGLIGVQAYQLNGSDYTFSEIRYLAIYKHQQTINFRTSTSVKFRKGKKVHLTATASSGLPVTFTSKGGAGKIVTKNGQKFLEVKKSGKVTVTASQAGDAVYNRATPISKAITIKK